MLIDWLSCSLSIDHLPQDQVRAWIRSQDKICRISGDGEHLWEVCAWESVRSDSHQIALQVNHKYVLFQGSPARIMGDGDNVFSCGAAAALDLVGCWQRMKSFVASHTGLPLPDDPTLYAVTRVDVTENLHVGSLPQVRQALAILRNCEGGRYRVSQQAGDTVYWQHKSRLRSGKAYAKGGELAHKMVQAGKSRLPQNLREYSLEEIGLASGLLRLELKLAAQFWRERAVVKWYAFKSEQLKQEWSDYFERMIGGLEMTDDNGVYERLLGVVYLTRPPLKHMHWVGQPSQGQARSAYGQWILIKTEGWEKARSRTSKTVWYRNLVHLRNAGLSDADIAAGNIVPLRRKIIEVTPVTSWEQLRRIKQAA